MLSFGLPRVCAGVLLLLAAASWAPAQTSRGTVTGLVTDASGAAVSNVSVELTSQQTNVTRSTTANDAGLYRFDAVDLGTYDVTFKATGFTTLATRGVVVQAGQIAAVDARLEVGQTQSTVEVSAQSLQLQTESPVRGGNIDTTKITQLPIASRNPVSLALTLPGVSSSRYGFGIGTFSVNGSRGRSNNFLIDGTENNDISVAGQGFQITNTDAVQEVSVQTSNYDAEFGRAGGAVVNVITKSGTNEFHGTLGYVLDSTRDDAITNLQSQSADVQRRGRPLPGTQQFFNGTFGGPLIRNKTFFFGAYQEQRESSQSQVSLRTLSAQGRATLNALFPQGANRNVDLYRQATGDATATSQLSNVELGDGRPAVEFGIAITPYAQKFQERQWQSRVDHTLSESSQLSGRFMFNDQFNPVGSTNFPGFFTSQKNRFMNALISETHTFSPSITNELRLSYNRIDYSFPLDPANPLGLTVPSIAFGGTISSALGIATNLPQGRIANNYVLQDTMNVVRGNHSIRFGGDLLLQRSRQFAPIVERGALSYQASTGYTSFANFVDDFGGANGSVQRDFGSPAYYPELFRYAFFGQDRWRPTSSLTLTLGLRYEYFGMPVNSLRTPAFTGLFNIDPVNFTGPYSEPNEVQPDRNNFSPTVGVVWSPSADTGFAGWLLGQKQTSIRTGYQVGYDSFFNNIASNAATSAPNLIATSEPSQATVALPRGLPNLSTRLPVTAGLLNPLSAQTLVLGNLVNPYYQRWSFGVQRELPLNVLADVSYIGSKGTRLFINEDMNPLVPASLRILPQTATPIPAARTQARLDQLQGSRLIRTNGGSSSYHAAQLDVRRRFANGFQASVAYTYSKFIDNGSEIFGTAGNNAPQQSAVPAIFGGQALDRAVSLFDRTHRTSITYFWQVPGFRDQRGAVGRLLGGWGLSGVTTFETGAPLNILNGQDADGLGGNFDRPDYNSAGRRNVRAVPSTTSPTGYVNPENNNQPINPAEAEFIGISTNTGATVTRTGNLGRFARRTPGISNFNVNVLKAIRLTERVQFELRAEFYNVLNHPQYGLLSDSPFAQNLTTTIQANVINSQAGTFLQPQFADGGGRVIRYQAKIRF